MSYGSMTVGVEEEFLLVGADGRLAARGPEVSAGVEQVDKELIRCQVETATEICSSAGEVLDALRRLRADLAAEAAEHGLRVLPSGTPPLAQHGPPPVTENQRYQQMHDEFGLVARATITSACHVHVAVPDTDAALRVGNALRPWLPVLLALCANSPFQDGADTGYASWRHLTWSQWPAAGPPPHLGSVAEYESIVEALLHSGAIVDRGMLYWDVRPSEHAPTVEFRAADVARTAEQATLLTVLVRALAAAALNAGPIVDPRSPELLRAQLWRAARDGLTGHCPDAHGELKPVWTVLEELLRAVETPLREQDDLDFARDALAGLRETGGGAQRQRAIRARRGELADVVDAFVLG